MVDHTERQARARQFIRQPLKAGKHWVSETYAYDYETEHAMYLGWFDDNGKKPTADKITEAMAAYQARFGTAPNVVLVNEADTIEMQGITVRTEGYIRRNNFWIGWEEWAR